MNISVAANVDRRRYEATVDDRIAGFMNYRLAGSTLVITHTEVESAYEGRGVGGALVRAALDDLRADEGRVRPVCPFAREWIERHPSYLDLMAEGERATGQG